MLVCTVPRFGIVWRLTPFLPVPLLVYLGRAIQAEADYLLCSTWLSLPLLPRPSVSLQLTLNHFRHILRLRRVDRQGPLLDHQRHNLIEDIRRRHCGQLGIGVIRRGNLDDVRRDEVDPLEPPDDGAQLSCGPASGLRRAGCGSERGVQSVNVDGQIHGVLGADAFLDTFDDPVHADGVDLAGFDAREAAVSVILVVRRATKCRPDACVDAAVVGEQSFFVGPVEIRAVVDGCLLGRRTTEDLGLPGIQVRVEVDHRDRSVGFIDAAQQRQGDGMVPSECYHARECLAGFADTGLVGGRERCAGEEGVVSVFDLLQRVVVVVAEKHIRRSKAGLAEGSRLTKSRGCRRSR